MTAFTVDTVPDNDADGLTLREAIEGANDGDAASDALINGNDLMLAFSRDGDDGALLNAVRLQDVIGSNLTQSDLEAAGATPFLIA